MNYNNNNSRLPLVSVIIPVYNRASIISETLGSVASQTYINWECIIVDDDSADKTEAVVKDFCRKDKRFKFFRNKRAKGAPGARNVGLDACSGEYVIYLDSDDLLEDFCIERRVDYFRQNPDEDFLVFPMYVFTNDKSNITGLWNVDNDEDDLSRFLRIDALWQTSGPMYKKDALKALQGFRESLSFWQDFDLHLRCLLSGYRYKKFLNICPDSFFRSQSGSSISSSIPFTASISVLKKRIEFYEFLIQYIINNNIQLSKVQYFTIWSSIGCLNRCYLLEHNQPGLFRENYNNQKRKFNKYRFYPGINYIYDWMLYYSRRKRSAGWLARAFKTVLKGLILDTDIFSQNTMLKAGVGI